MSGAEESVPDHLRLATNEGRVHFIPCERCDSVGIEPFELLTDEQRQEWRETGVLVPCSDCGWDGQEGER